MIFMFFVVFMIFMFFCCFYNFYVFFFYVVFMIFMFFISGTKKNVNLRFAEFELMCLSKVRLVIIFFNANVD